jgi:endonuclease/exonuclease/phosphatase family metal-dependent hydrolase
MDAEGGRERAEIQADVMTSLVIAALQLVVQAASSTSSSSPRRPAYLPDQRIDFIFGRYDFSILGFAVIVMLLVALTRALNRRRSRTKALD